jgi:hypothetical protein
MTLLDTHTFGLASDQMELSAKAAAAFKKDIEALMGARRISL